jgi:hypothetical protein
MTVTSKRFPKSSRTPAIMVGCESAISIRFLDEGIMISLNCRIADGKN